jgi:nitroreductase
MTAMNPSMHIDPQSLLRLIKARRTVRQFDPDRPVSLGSLKRILTAGTWAPYAPYDPQGWRFIALKGSQRDPAVAIVTKSKTILKYIRAMYEAAPWGGEAESEPEHAWKEFARDFAKNLGNAPVIIVGMAPWNEAQSIRGHNLGSAWAAAQNMMLQAEAEGLASGIVTFHSPIVEQELIEFLGLSNKNWMVAFVLNVGHPLEKPKAAPRKENLYTIRG